MPSFPTLQRRTWLGAAALAIGQSPAPEWDTTWHRWVWRLGALGFLAWKLLF